MPTTTTSDRERVLGPNADRVHMIEYKWLDQFLSAHVFVYRFDADDFMPYGDDTTAHAYVAHRPVWPLAPATPAGNLLELHEQAGIELRLVHSLWPWWQAVIHSSVGSSGIRLRNAQPAN